MRFLLALVLLSSPSVTWARGKFSDSCTQLLDQVKKSYLDDARLPGEEEELRQQYGQYSEARNQIQNKMKKKRSEIELKRKNAMEQSEKLSCPPMPETATLKALAQQSLEAERVNPDDSNKPNGDQSREMNAELERLTPMFSARFPSVKFRKWDFKKSPTQADAADRVFYDFTAVGQTTKKVQIDGLSYPPGVELFLEGNTKDISASQPDRKVFRRVRIINKGH